MLTEAPNKIGRANRRPASPFDVGRQYGSASCAPPSLSAAVAHLWRSATHHAMDKAEAEKIITEQLARFERRSHSELKPLVEAQQAEGYEVRGVSGATYQIEINFYWDSEPGETIRVMGSIDDGGIRAYSPLTESVLVKRTERLIV